MEDVEAQIRMLQLELRGKERQLANSRAEHTKLLENVELFREQAQFYEDHLHELKKADVVNLRTYHETRTYLPTSKEQLKAAQTKLRNVEELIKKDLPAIKQLNNRISTLEKSLQHNGKLLQFPSK